jgi:hypothetical protein
MPAPTPLSTRQLAIEALIASVCGLGFLWLADVRLGRVHMLDAFNTADMVDYCNGILHLSGDTDVAWSLKRSRITGLVAAAIAESRGIMGGLRGSSVVATALIGSGLYLWGRVASGRTAGLIAVAAGLAFSPLVLLPRILTFYPMVSAFFVLGAVGLTAGIVHRTPRTLALAGAGIGLALLADVRGLVWAVPWTAGALIAVWQCANRKRAMLWLMAPLLASFAVARWSYPADSVSFERQLDVRPLFLIYGSEDPAHQGPHDSGGDFVWGRSGPWRLPQTGWFVLQQLQLEAPEGFPPDVSAFVSDDHLTPLMPVWFGAGFLALGICVLRPRTLLAVAAGTAPFAIAFYGQQGMAEIRVRFLCQAMPGLALLIGVGLGELVDRIPGPLMSTPGRSHPVRALLAGGLVLATTLGEISSPASPWARWRRPWPIVGELVQVHPSADHTEQLSARKQICAAALAHDAEADKWIPALRRRR